jgi:type I restriction enzyme S subunit
VSDRVLLGDIAEVFNGKTPSKVEQRHIGHPVLKVRDVDEHGRHRRTTGSFVDPELAAKYPSKWVRAGDTLILNAAHHADYVASKTYFAGEEAVGALATGEWLLVRPQSDAIHPEFVNYWLRSPRTRDAVRFLVKGIHLYPKDVAGLELLRPSMVEQRRFIDLLARAEGIVRLRREAEQKAAELIPAIFIDMFGDPAMNPKQLPLRSVRELVARFEGGKNLQAGSDGGTDFRILKVSAVTSGEYVETESKPTPNGYEPPQNHVVREGDMLFSRSNTEELVGATAVVRATNGRTLLPDKLWRFVWAEPVEQAFMHALFQSAHVRRELGKLSSGTSASMRNISQAKLFELRLPVPSLEKQRAFARHADAAQSIRSQQEVGLAKAEATFDALLSRAFS